jgi:hypothetical protein
MRGRKGRRALSALFVLGVALVTAASVSPAAAAPSAATATGFGCEWATGAGQFSSLGQLGSAVSARQGFGQSRKERQIDRGAPEDPAADTVKVKRGDTAVVPVYIHVLNTGPAPEQGNLPLRQLVEQVVVLNTTFGGFRGGANTGFRFVLAGVDRTTNAEWFAMEPETPTELAAKTALHRGGLNALNIYTTNGGNDQYLGWAYFPKDAKRQPAIDGIVIHYGSLPGGFIDFFNLGFTATHEAGHWLGLYHTFDFGCKKEGDKVKDTPEMLEPTSGCPEGKDTCPQPGLDPIHNYMDYSIDSCYTEFTNGQTERMQKQYRHYRS